MANDPSNHAVIIRYIEHYLARQWPDVPFRADIIRNMMELNVHVRILVPTPSGKYVYVTQIHNGDEIKKLADFKLEETTIAQIMLLMG